MLKIEKLNVYYGEMQVIWDLKLEVHQGEIVTVVGSNGAGKSSTLKAISKLVAPRSGSIVFQGQELSGMQSHEIVELGVVHVPEGRKIFSEMTVLENLRMGSYIKSARKERDRSIDYVFELFPRLKERKDQLGGTMSGGEQQMLAIGRGLVARPKLLMLDEPSLGLSPLLVSGIFEIIKEINKQGLTILLVEQNVNQSLQISNRAYVLETGKLVMEGAGKDLLSNDHVRKAFLGL